MLHYAAVAVMPMVPLLWLACLVPPALAQCSLVSVSGCQPDPHQVIQAVTAPSHQACQQLCRDEDQCRHWSYERATLTCSLLAHCYLRSCAAITAGPAPACVRSPAAVTTWSEKTGNC